MAGPRPGRSDMPLPPRSPTTAPQPTRSLSRAAFANRSQQAEIHRPRNDLLASGITSEACALPPQPHPLRLVLQRLEIPLYCRFHLASRLARHFVEHSAPHPFAQGLELRLLFRVEQRLDLLVEGDADLPQLLDL